MSSIAAGDSIIDDSQYDGLVQAKNGDPSHNLVSVDALGGPPYCFRLNNSHPAGVQGILQGYMPPWDWSIPYNPEIANLKIKFKHSMEDNLIKKTEKKEQTHVALNGGSFHIAFGHPEDEFLKDYSYLVLAGKKMYLSELRSPITRIYIDLDFHQLVGVTERGIEAAVVVVSKTVHTFFPGFESNAIVSSTTYKGIEEKDSKGNIIKLVQTGVHIHFPDFFVRKSEMLDIRESIIANCIDAFGTRSAPNMNPWEKVVDDSIYGDGKGLRMIGSFKAKPCTAKCKHGKAPDNTRCKTCFGSGKIEDTDLQKRGRPYMLLCVLHGPSKQFERNLEAENRYKQNFYQLVLHTKLRTPIVDGPEYDNHFRMPDGAPKSFETMTGKKRSTREKAMPGLRGGRHVEANDPVHNEIQKIIRESFGELYNQIVVRKVMKVSKQYTVNITGLNCRYCQNIGDEHKSNNIFFVVSQDGVAQRCYDDGTVDERMRHGPCKDYVSSRIPLSVRSKSILWQETNETLSAFGVGAPEPEANPIFQSYAMQALLNAGEYLSTSLYGVSWTSTLGLASSKRSKGLSDYMPQDPKDLGSRGIEAYKDLGLSWADTLVQILQGDTHMENDEGNPHVTILPLAHLERELFDTFLSIVSVTLSQAHPDVFDLCMTMDSFLQFGAHNHSENSDSDIDTDDENGALKKVPEFELIYETSSQF